jgi:hypothetical protein
LANISGVAAVDRHSVSRRTEGALRFDGTVQ